MRIGEKSPYGFEGETKPVGPNDTSVIFTAKLNEGPIALHTWFRGSDGHRGSGTGSTILSAYYVYVTRK